MKIFIIISEVSGHSNAPSTTATMPAEEGDGEMASPVSESVLLNQMTTKASGWFY